MIIVNIIGGLGNQMFQYAAARALSLRSKLPLKLQISEFQDYDLRDFELHVFNIEENIASIEEINELKYQKCSFFKRNYLKMRKKSLPLSTSFYPEPHFNFDSHFIKINSSKLVSGYWQSEKYFSDFEDTIRKDFSLKKELSAASSNFLEQIINSNAVSLHVRRGDYVTDKTTNSVHGTCDLDYYTKAVTLLAEKYKELSLYIFSDDIDWVKDNIKFDLTTIFVELADNIPDCEEMYLMSQCKHNIIANSSFSWWGAWLNSNVDKTVIAPVKWFNDSSIDTHDLIPAKWIRV